MSPINLPTLWGKPWWRAVEPLLLLGYDVMVVDPEAGEGESLWDGDQTHGTCRIVDYPAAGWEVSVRELLAPYMDEPTPVPDTWPPPPPDPEEP